MSFESLVSDVRALAAAVRSGEPANALDAVGKIAQTAAGLLRAFGVKAVAPPEMAAAVADLEAACGGPAAAGILDPERLARILALIKLIADLFGK